MKEDKAIQRKDETRNKTHGTQEEEEANKGHGNEEKMKRKTHK